MAQNSIIELQVINYVVKNKDLEILKRENIQPQYFSETYKDIINYVFDHEKKYQTVPDEVTMISQFGQDYTVLEVNETPKYLVDKLKDFLGYVYFAKDFAVAKPMIDSGNMEGAAQFLKNTTEQIAKLFGQRNEGGVDIMTDGSRLEEYEKRLTTDEGESYSLGIDALDDAFGGLLRDDLMVLFARLANGKSYLMTLLAHTLHQQGLKVLFYSGEMEANQVGYRYDSIDSHFSNKALLFGRHFDQGQSFAQYKTYIERLASRPNYFKVICPKDLGGRFINMNDIKKLVDELKPDVIFLDQLSLVEDIRSTKTTPERTRYNNIMADLRVLANTQRIPVIVAAQANREATAKDDAGDVTIPEIHHIAESDAIGQHSTRAIAFCTHKFDDSGKLIMKLAVRKNRHGASAEFKMNVDFEHGIFEELKHKPLGGDGSGAF